MPRVSRQGTLRRENPAVHPRGETRRLQKRRGLALKQAVGDLDDDAFGAPISSVTDQSIIKIKQIFKRA